MPQVLKYEEAREQIKDGDLIYFHSGKDLNPIHWLVEWVTESDFYHTAIAFWLYSATGEKRLFVVEGHPGGRRIVNLSEYADKDMEVISAPVPWEKLGWNVLDKTGEVHYGYTNYVKIGLREKFGIKLKDNKDEVCSEMVAKVITEAGYTKLSTTSISPGEEFRQLLAAGEVHSISIRK